MSGFFLFITLYIVALNLLLGALQYGLLRCRLPRLRGLQIAVVVWTLFMVGLFLLQAFAPEAWHPFLWRWFYFPFAVEMFWNLLFLQVLVLVAIVATLLLGRLRPIKPVAPPLEADALSRRRFVYLLACGAAPATAIAMGVHGSDTRFDLRVRRFDLPIPGLPPELDGFTIAHVSDLHSGIFCGPRRLDLIASATNDLQPDLVVVTGDIINNNMAEFPDALAILQRLRSRHGLFLCEGNHDTLPGPGVLADACARHNIPWLSNSTAIVPVEGRRLVLAGLPWMGRHVTGTPEMVDGLYPARQPGDLRILLAHHPHYFDYADSVDLVLSGHTHGGQLMLGDIGFGPLFFKYWSGLYRRNATTLVVSNGAGDWFPCRVGAPAEIGLLRLKPQAYPA